MIRALPYLLCWLASAVCVGLAIAAIFFIEPPHARDDFDEWAE